MATPFPLKFCIILFIEFHLRKVKSILNRAVNCPGHPFLNFLDLQRAYFDRIGLKLHYFHLHSMFTLRKFIYFKNKINK